ncbi:MAG TPA: hypothetical protein PKH91_04835 [Flavobacterium sp.]|nr:hypothetical protein [Flavobacterium sp.]
MSFIQFNIQKTVEKEIFYGSYYIYILGGHHIEANPDFYIKIENIDTGKEIELTEKSLKGRDFKFGKKAIQYFSFETNEYGKFRISAHNFEDIVVKNSILEVFPFPLSIPNIVLSAILGRSRKKLELKDIEILIA